MLDSTALTLNQLPPEILYGVSRYLDVPDILRIRRVSRYLCQVSRTRDVWSDAYRKAEFVRPPGPFLSQSAQDLENALVPSWRVDQNLRSCQGGAFPKERQTRKLREIRYTGIDLHASLIFGRFLFIAFCKEVRSYDLNIDAFDSNSGANIIYRSTGGTLESFHCVSAFDIEGHPFACAVLSEVRETKKQISIYSLNVCEESEVTLDLLHQFEPRVFDIEAIHLGPRVIAVYGGDGNLAPWGGQLIALDVHTRTQFVLSSLVGVPWDSETTGLPGRNDIEEFTSPTCISTSTHLVVTRSFYTQNNGWSTFIQAFTLPLPHINLTSSPSVLSLSHQGSIHNVNMRDTMLLRDTIFDPSTQDFLITIRVHAYELSRPRSSISRYGVLRLSPITPSHDHDSEIGTVTFKLLGPLGRVSSVPFLHPSFNGTGRSFYTLEPAWWIVSMLEYNLPTNGGDDNHHNAKVVEFPSILTFPTARTLLDYDPYSGRICLRSSMSKYSVIEIFDLAV